MAGSARKPIARLVMVMPTWAPDSWVDSERSALSTPGRGGVTLGRGPGDLGPVDGDEGELRRDEDTGSDHQQDRDAEQEPGGQHRARPSSARSSGEGRLSEPSMGGSGSFGLGRRAVGRLYPRPARRLGGPGRRSAHGVASSLTASQSTKASRSGSSTVTSISSARHWVRGPRAGCPPSTIRGEVVVADGPGGVVRRRPDRVSGRPARSGAGRG